MTSLDASFDQTIDPNSATVLSKSIHEMLQQDPSLRPTAATVLETFSIHDLAAEMKDIHTQPNEGPLINPTGPPPDEVAGPLPIFRQLPNPERVIPAASQVTDQRQWIVISTIVNPSHTRIATVSCDSDLEYSQVTLWDASTGDNIYRRQYPWTGIHLARPDPTFSSDGKYFGIHDGDKAVEILDAHYATPVNTLALQSEGRIMAIAVLKNGKRAAVAVDSGILDVPSEGTDLATLNDVRSPIGSHVDIVHTRVLSGISLAYDPRGRHLFLVGHSTTRSGNGLYPPFGCCWDTIIRGSPMIFQPENFWAIRSWITPLYNVPSNDFATFRGLSRNLNVYIDSFTSTGSYGLILFFATSAICSFGSQSILVLGSEDSCKVSDWATDRWIDKQCLERPDYSDKTVYKYLLSCEAKVLENNNTRTRLDTEFVAKLAWDNMPPLTDVKGFVETDAGLTFILEGEKFIFFGKEA